MKPGVVNDYYASGHGDGKALGTWAGSIVKVQNKPSLSQPPAPRGKSEDRPSPGSHEISQNLLESWRGYRSRWGRTTGRELGPREL
jgi:hypothetical protein